MNQSRFLSLLALSLAGCAVAIAPGSGNAPDSGGRLLGSPGIGGAEAHTVAESAAGPAVAGDQTGSLLIAVRWPDRGSSYRTQLIPESSAKIRVRVLGPDGTTELADTLLTRPTGGNLVSTASIDVTAGVNRLVEIGAYSESGVLVASGSAKVDVASSTETDVAVVLIPTAVPGITGVSPPNGGPGAEIQLVGNSFLLNGGFPTIRFTGGATVSPTAFSDTLLGVSVPNGALTGPVVVAVDGIEATSSEPFTMLGSLLLSPSATSGVATGSQVAFTLSGRDTGDSPVEGASASLAIVEIGGSDEDPASYSASVLANVVTLTPQSSGTWEIKATSGTLTATASLESQ